MNFGLDRFLAEAALRTDLAGKRVALLAHPASVTADLTHALDAIAALPDVQLTAAFGPQHGIKGDKQDNMMESPDFIDPLHQICTPVHAPTDGFVYATHHANFAQQGVTLVSVSGSTDLGLGDALGP